MENNLIRYLFKNKVAKSTDFQYILILFFLSLLLIFFLSYVGSRARSVGEKKELIFLRTSSQALNEWKARHLRGRTLLYIGSELPLKVPVLNLTSDPEANLQSLNSMLNSKEILPKSDNFLYPALLDGVFRQLIWVLPTNYWGRKKIKVQSYLFQKRSNFESYALLEGSPLIICTLEELPPIKEKFLVYIDANSLGPEFISELSLVFRKKNISADLITVFSNPSLVSTRKVLRRKFQTLLEK